MTDPTGTAGRGRLAEDHRRVLAVLAFLRN
jgi:hypothetical protein